MKAPIRLELTVVLAIDDEQLAEHGGQPGVRDYAVLDSALSRAKRRFAYGSKSLAELAASLAFEISGNHPFIDGNKRTSLDVAELSLSLIAVEISATDADCVATLLALAAGEVSEAQLAIRLERHS